MMSRSTTSAGVSSSETVIPIMVTPCLWRTLVSCRIDICVDVREFSPSPGTVDTNVDAARCKRAPRKQRLALTPGGLLLGGGFFGSLLHGFLGRLLVGGLLLGVGNRVRERNVVGILLAAGRCELCGH